MIKANIHEIKAQLSHYLERALQGEQVVICKHNRPVAEIKRLQVDARSGPRPFGLAKGGFEVPAAFFDPLPEEEVALFYPDAAPSTTPRVSHVAETPPLFGTPPTRRAQRRSRKRGRA